MRSKRSKRWHRRKLIDEAVQRLQGVDTHGLTSKESAWFLKMTSGRISSSLQAQQKVGEAMARVLNEAIKAGGGGSSVASDPRQVFESIVSNIDFAELETRVAAGILRGAPRMSEVAEAAARLAGTYDPAWEKILAAVFGITRLPGESYDEMLNRGRSLMKGGG